MKDTFCKWHKHQRVKVTAVEVKEIGKTVEVVHCPMCDVPPTEPASI